MMRVTIFSAPQPIDKRHHQDNKGNSAEEYQRKCHESFSRSEEERGAKEHNPGRKSDQRNCRRVGALGQKLSEQQRTSRQIRECGQMRDEQSSLSRFQSYHRRPAPIQANDVPLRISKRSTIGRAAVSRFCHRETVGKLQETERAVPDRR